MDVCHKDAIKIIKDAGFDAYDFSFFRSKGDIDILGDDYIERARDIRAYADSIGAVCNQAHAPFEMRSEQDFSQTSSAYVRITRAIEAAAILGASVIVVHPIKLPGERFYEINREFYRSLIPYARAHGGIKIGVENLFFFNHDVTRISGGVLDDPCDHEAFVRSLGLDDFCACLDIGHTAVTGRKPEDAISVMSPEVLLALHVHDNDCVLDKHMMPYTASLDFEAICAALGKIGYRGDMTLELISAARRIPEGAIPEAFRLYSAIARELIKKVEAARAQ